MPVNLVRLLPFALLFSALSAQAQVEDLPGSADHPLISRLSGSHLVAFDEQEFERYSLMTGLWNPKENQYRAREVEGRISRCSARDYLDSQFTIIKQPAGAQGSADEPAAGTGSRAVR
jgi:hypothetical protein